MGPGPLVKCPSSNIQLGLFHIIVDLAIGQYIEFNALALRAWALNSETPRLEGGVFQADIKFGLSASYDIRQIARHGRLPPSDFI